MPCRPKFKVLWRIGKLCFVKAFLQTSYFQTLIGPNFGTDTVCRRSCSYAITFFLQIFTYSAGWGGKKCCDGAVTGLVLLSRWRPFNGTKGNFPPLLVSYD
jgi:hypothetical protein